MANATGSSSASEAPTLARFFGERNPILQNELLFGWLCDDRLRNAFYRELREHGYPTLRVKSMLGRTGQRRPVDQDVYFMSHPDDVRHALVHYSVAPYGELESGGSFMLGLDSPARHDFQNAAAVRALAGAPDERSQIAADIERCAAEAVRRALVLPLKRRTFDAAMDVADEAALRFVELFFGFRDLAHRWLNPFMRAAYERLAFQIIGRHFVADSGLSPADSERGIRVRQGMADELNEALGAARTYRMGDAGFRATVIARLVNDDALDDDLLQVVIIGLVAGTIGNIRASVCVALADFFDRDDACKHWRIDQAREHAWKDEVGLDRMIHEAHARNPPAAFLARTEWNGTLEYVDGETCEHRLIPPGAHVLLAMGPTTRESLATEADGRVHGSSPLVFGGLEENYMHRCIGRHVALPLVREIVRQILRLPGIAQSVDPETGELRPVRKRWGVMYEHFPLDYQRDRRLNQQPLHLSIPIKEPVADNAAKLEALLKGGAFLVEDALDRHKHVHFAWFMLTEGKTHLSMMTAYDGDFDAYVEHFALVVELFDEQLKFLKEAPRLPVSKYPKEFVAWVKKFNSPPMGNYFYSAYPLVTTSEIDRAFEVTGAGKKTGQPS